MTDRSTTKEIGIVDIGELEVTFPPKKSTRTDRSNTSNIMTRSRAKTLFDDNRLKNCGKTIASRPPSMMHNIKRMLQEAEKTPDIMPNSPAPESIPMLLYGFGDHLNGRLPPGYTKSSNAVNKIDMFWMVDCRQPSSLRNLRIVERYEHLAPFLRASLI